MRILSLNINPPDKCDGSLRSAFVSLSREIRIERVATLIQDKKPDIIFFIEQWYPVYGGVKESLKDNYTFCYPRGFTPSRKTKSGFLSFSGVVASVNKTITDFSYKDGTHYVYKNAKWLCLTIHEEKYLCVHYPQPKDDWESFNDGVAKYATEEHPVVIMGDFNTPQGRAIKITDYADVMAENEPTFAAQTKLDYIFVQRECQKDAHAENIVNVRNPNSSSFFSDHSATLLVI